MKMQRICITAALAACGTIFPIQHASAQVTFEFSLDIGSDTELSDPNMDGDEIFDPGDVYVTGPVGTGPYDGFKDDEFLFGIDPQPDPPFGGGAPVCLPGQTIQNYVEFFDLDAHDQYDFQLVQFLNLDQPLPQPIGIMPSNCIHEMKFLQLSFDDDMRPGWVACDVPVNAPSPAGVSSYGTTTARDEIIGIDLAGGGFPMGVAATYPILDEAGVHPAMAPNPDAGDEDDDDVDSLDAVFEPGQCPTWAWSPDHEGRAIDPFAGGPLDPGGIYERIPGGFAQIIDEVTHLGIPEETDIDAFEFVWTEHSQFGQVLTLIYSVDDDDPLTLGDESGGLNPRMIYASYLTGFSFAALADPLEDDIDALSAWREPFGQTEACCFPDGSCADLTVADCLAAGGAPQGAGTNCATTICPQPTEACCFPDGSCADITPAACVLFGGTPQGVGTICATTTCPQPTEACCFPDGSCADLTAADCVASGGAPQGAGTNCATTSCPQPTEACCFPDGSCADLTAADCVASGGAPQGAGTNCATTSCPQPTEACCYPDGSCADITPADCIATGGTPQGAGTTCATVTCTCPDNPRFEFSVDLGSDSELSDPNMDGDEVFDPGDVYLQGGVLAGPANGFKDDAMIFLGSDIAPTPFGPVAPICLPGQSIQNYVEYFDLDGHDQLDRDITDLVPQGTADFTPQFPSGCIFAPEFLAISFDDDRGVGWVGCDVPVTSLSPAGLRHGTTPIQDEVVGLVLGGGGLFPVPVINQYGIASERQFHPNMRPDPDLSEADDDDVDSLDSVLNPDMCPFWYFTADHEGRSIDPVLGLPLDPGSIYLVTAAGPVQVIDDVAHLGLLESTDVDAFEFTWLPDPNFTGTFVFGIVFSVDDDDPLTPGDESGGLDPRQLYGSYLNGTNFPMLVDPLEDDVDAITAWCAQYQAAPPCPGDVNGDAAVDFNDLNIVLANWGMIVVPGTNGDANGDGVVDFNDLNIVLANWGMTCP